MLESLLEFLIQGVVLGGLYALFAVGLSLIFGVLDVINVAHGEFFAVGGYLAFAAVVLLHLPGAAGVLGAAVGTFLLGLCVWVAFFKGGIDPVVAGLLGGVIALAYPAQRSDLERASDLFRVFREQPTGDLARTARAAVKGAVSPNERLQALWHPWTSYAIVPLFALANAGVNLSGSFLAHAFTSRVTLGILLGYVLGKPIGIAGSTWLATRLEADDEEEERHQTAVHPVAQILPDARAADANREPRMPHGVV